VKLIALRCPRCARPLAVGPEDVIVACANCQTAVQIGDEGLRIVEVAYLSAAVSPDEMAHWWPFWVFNGRVHIRRRETQGGGSSGQRDADQLWGVSRRLYAPAWNLSLHEAQAVGATLAQTQPHYQTSDCPAGATLAPATLTAADALKLLEFVILAVEARRSDWLKTLEFDLETDAGQLWALPATVVERLSR
jgi:hypothetical protein